jgi:hypothetical protein
VIFCSVKKEGALFFKQVLRSFMGIFLVLILSSPVLTSQLKLLCKFKGVALPYTLKYQGKVLEKGKYDLEAVKKATSTDYYLRIKKRGKVLDLIQGEQWDYQTRGTYLMRDPSIPDEPTLKMKKNLEEKVFYITIETGRKNRIVPFARLRFKFGYEE